MTSRSICVEVDVDDTVRATIPLRRLSDADLAAVVAEMKARGANITGEVIDVRQAEQLIVIRQLLARNEVRDATRRLDALIEDLIAAAKTPRVDRHGDKQRHALYGLVGDLHAALCLPEPIS